MIQNLPKDLLEAVELLERFEKSEDHLKRTRDFHDAIEILNHHMQDTPDTSHKQYIENLKRTYKRKLFEQLPSLSTLDQSDWIKYLMLLMLFEPNENEALFREHPHLRYNERAFIAIWIDETIAELQRISKRRKEITK